MEHHRVMFRIDAYHYKSLLSIYSIYIIQLVLGDPDTRISKKKSPNQKFRWVPPMLNPGPQQHAW